VLDLPLTRLYSLIPTSLVLVSLPAACLSPASPVLILASFVLASLVPTFPALVAALQAFLATSPAPASPVAR
jgi:hypothetical protein